MNVDTEKKSIQVFKVTVNGKRIEFETEFVTAGDILHKAGFEKEFCLAATEGEHGKVIKEFSDADKVDLKEYKFFRATFCGSETVS